MRFHGSGKLITRDGNYRDGTYEIQVDADANGHAARVAGFFDLAGEAAMRGVDEEFIGYATIVLDDTTEATVALDGRHDNRVGIVAFDPAPTRSP